MYAETVAGEKPAGNINRAAIVEIAVGKLRGEGVVYGDKAYADGGGGTEGKERGSQQNKAQNKDQYAFFHGFPSFRDGCILS